ncbi:MAG TPA: FeS assembly SUF system protein, partial [Dysgonamonadaceae bacterium]|nr:FeS assembly SUF system protein [Dysgonamonadaceae bacterium]
FIIDDLRMKVEAVKAVNKVNIELVFDPPWDRSMMSEEAMLELGLL